jgi:hypothetical protein
MSAGVRFVAILVGVAMTMAVVAGCGGSSSQPDAACIVIDASKSTRFAIYDYKQQFHREAIAIGEGGGRIAVVTITGDPLVESDVEVSEDFSGLTSLDQTSQLVNAVGDFTAGVDRSMLLASSGGSEPAAGSGIVAGIVLIAKQGCASIEVLSDGLEASDVHMKTEDILTAAGRAKILDRLEARDLLPSLEGVELRFPFGGYLPQGTAIEKARLESVPKFWADFADRTGAELTWRQ